MAANTLSEIYSSVYNSLGKPEDDLLDRLELATIIFRRISYRMESVRQSPQRESIAKTSEFTLSASENEKNLTTLDSNFVIPLWCEAKGWNYLGNPAWIYVPTVNLSILAEQRTLGRPACSFYGANPTEVKVQFSFYGNETWAPFSTLRVWYTPIVGLPDNELEGLELPDNLVSMVQYDAMVSALPLMIVNASKQFDKRPELKDQVRAWEGLYQHLNIERAEFERYFELWRRKSRGGSRPTMRSDVLTQVLGNNGGRFPWLVNNGN